MKIGDYVRTKRGQIFTWENNMTTKELASKVGYDGCYIYVDKDSIVKSSPNIIELIEVGDYVNGNEVDDFYIKYDEKKDIFNNIGVITIDCYLGDVNYSWVLEKDIKSIVTKEQFASMEYRVED